MINYILKKIFGSKNQRELKRIEPLIDEINKFEPQMKIKSDVELRASTVRFKKRLASGESLDDLLPEAFATVREASCRVLGMRHFDVQLIGGIVLHKGKIAEMKTGEGKTLVATLPVYLNALEGRGVHVVTVNDYLARRDSEWMGALYRFLGLSVGTIQHDMRDDDRYCAYRADVTYGTNNEFGFDYLRDNMKVSLSLFVQRGHRYAIVDEVDSILIDEARTPLIISGPTEESTDKYYKINQLIPKLRRELDYQIDEKSRSVSLTEAGVAKAEQFLTSMDLLQISNEPDSEYEGKKRRGPNLYDAINMEVVHHVNQALKAHTLFKRDVDYVVKDGEVIIVDEFTGRLMPGRRFSDGLHQALEAKESVTIANENQTLASITFQNYFRLYKKLAGMTGTAETEAEELFHTYKLDVVVIPTNRTLIRINYPDVIYKTVEEKFKAVVNEIVELHTEHNRPILVGTTSIENSEKLSKMLQQKHIKHEVLNAKYHEQEAQIISRAGQPGAVTISTNMAGRGTDIVLGEGVVKCEKDELNTVICCLDCKKDCAACPKGDNRDEYTGCAENVPCGLHIIGTERHEARRIDNQLRGRSGRQGDPGSSRFYLSLEDDLMRIFGSERVMSIMDRFGIEEDQPIEHSMVTKAIETAQKRVEAHNFSIRKHLLEYDDVMNRQREIVYKQRREVLACRSLKDVIFAMIQDLIEATIDEFTHGFNRVEDIDIDGLSTALKTNFNYELPYKKTEVDSDVIEASFPDETSDTASELQQPTEADEKREITPDMSVMELSEIIEETVIRAYEEKESIITAPQMRLLEKEVMLFTIDSLWKDHLLAMDYLREGIGLRGYGQQDPLIEYKKEGFQLFEEMIARIKTEVVRRILFIQVSSAPQQQQTRRVRPQTKTETKGSASTSRSKPPAKPALPPGVKIGRNDPCYCGSGKKYKKCHGR